MSERVSVVIPTLNEAGYLPHLLDALRRQTRHPDEIIVADAGSGDGTAQIARQAGARIVTGGRPAVGRNAGAQAATGDRLLFLDADTLPAPDFLAHMLHEFDARKLDVATCLITPLSQRRTDRLLYETTNLFLWTVQGASPHAPGFCILIKRNIHQTIGGFDETLAMAEDHDYVQRAARRGKFSVLTCTRIPVSVRRVEKEGRIWLAMKYAYCEMYMLTRRPIHSVPFTYEFGNHVCQRLPIRRRFVDVGRLRGHIIPSDNPIVLVNKHTSGLLETMRSWHRDRDN